MFRRILLVLILLTLCASVGFSVTFEGLPFALQAAKGSLATQPPDPAYRHEVALELERLCQVFPGSTLIPEALLLASQLEKSAGNSERALALARNVAVDFGTSESAPAAFEIAWQDFSASKVPFAAAEFTRSCAALIGTSRSSYLKSAYESFRAAGRWKEALEVGAHFVRVAAVADLDMVFAVTLADVALRSGNTGLAQQTLAQTLANHGSESAAVAARVTLAAIYQSAGNPDAARQAYAESWSQYQKNRRTPAYSQNEVKQAAAEALWALQSEPRREFESFTVVNGSLDRNRAREKAEQLLRAYDEVSKTDPDAFSARCLNAQADIHARLADAMLKDGFKSVTNPSPDRAPYRDALPEYAQAARLYEQAYDQAEQAVQSAESRQASRYAATRAFEVVYDQGDVLFAWALELQRRAPQGDPGLHSENDRVAYIADKVVPLVHEGLAYKHQALDLATIMPLKSEAANARLSLDLAAQPVARELLASNHEQLAALKSQSTELASTFSMGFQVATAAPLARAVDEKFEVAMKRSAEVQSTLNALYASLEKCEPAPRTGAVWDSLLAASYFEYSVACRTVQDNLNTCVASLSLQSGESAQVLQKKLGKLQEASATYEMTNLLAWHEFASRNNVDSPLSDRMEARLAELDPAHFGILGDPSANRRKP